jgi:6-pyruvoyltetrahydropterin/6-carboxytetrahydropterin synthase
VDVHVTGPVDPRSGWVTDFAQIAHVVEPIIAELDHRLLNDVPGLGNPTAERIAHYLFNRIAPSLPGLSVITVWESDTSRAVYRGT